MIIVVGGIKGGTGKTTIATNLTVMQTHKTLLIDADEQHSAYDWATQRESQEGIETNWVTIQLSGKSIHNQIKKMVDDYHTIIIDVGGRDTTSQRSALAIADVCIIPFKPRSLDIWTLGSLKIMLEEIKAINPKLCIIPVINQADCRGNDNEDAKSILKEIDIFDSPAMEIGNRKAFANAASQGLSVIEMNKVDAQAVEEMMNIHNFICSTRNVYT